ncbi:hypothetical protein PG985_008704 [Apiospora marii]|uniref:uncharacterized protein n=1 Tax=Apiospora marii TaxID=335849 RepID=UPI00312FAA78
MPPNATNTGNESASDHLGPHSIPTPSEPSPRIPRGYCLVPRDKDWAVKDITSPSLVNGIVKVKATWNNGAVWRDSARKHDLAEFATDTVGSFELASINGRGKQDGRKVLLVSYCDSMVEVKDLGGYWLKHARKLVIKKWGKRRGEKIWRRQLRYKRQFEGNM